MGLCLLAMIAVGGGALLTNLVREFEPATDPMGAARVEDFRPQAPVDAPATTELAQAPPPAIEAPPAPQLLAAQTLKAKATTPRTPRRAKPVKAVAPAPLSPQEQWEQQRRDYQSARDTYDANERSEGYRWAQQNRVRVHRYCRALEKQRTPAFMQGCMNYVGSLRAKGSDSAQAAAEPG